MSSSIPQSSSFNSQQELEDDDLIAKIVKGSSKNNKSDKSSVTMIQFDMFLRFKTKGLTDDFRAFKVKTTNRPFAILVLIFALFIMTQRGVFYNDVKVLLHENPAYLVMTYLQKILQVCTVITLYIGYAPKQYFFKSWDRVASFQLAYDTCFVLAAIYGCVRVITRVVQGTCPPDISVWHSQVCNTNGMMKELPLETFVAATTYNIAFQVFLRSSTPTALLLTWIAIIPLMNVALYMVESPLTLYINLLLLILAMTSYEIERGLMQCYVNQKFALDSAEVNAKLKIELAEANTAFKVDFIHAQMNEEKRALDSKREMVRHIAHEIRTPLNIVTVATDIIITELKKINAVPQFVFDTLNSCQEACAISCDIVNDLLNFEKLAAGLVTLEKMPMVLSTYVQRVLNPFYVSAGAKDLVINYQYTLSDHGQDVVVDNPETVEDVVEIDSVKMSSVLRNLLSNAIKFAKETIVVKVSVVRKLELSNGANDDDQAYSSGHAVISVKDDGAGISSGNLSRLFQEGVQFNANELQKGGGSGFGLYIAKGIVNLHTNSRMWAESDGEGMGATFFVKLPLSDVVLPSTPQSKLTIDCSSPVSNVVEPLRQSIVSDAVDALNATLPPLVILVVDDSPINRRLTIQLLKQICKDTHSCTFLEADDGQEAVSCVMQSLVAPMLHFAHYRPPRSNMSRNQSVGSSRHISAEVSPHISGCNTPILLPPRTPLLMMSPRTGSKQSSDVNSRALSRRNSQDHDISLVIDDHEAVPSRTNSNSKLFYSLDVAAKVGGTRSLDCSSEGSTRGGGGGSRSLTNSGKGGLSSGSGGLMTLPEERSESFRRSASVQIDIVFMDYNMPRMVRVLAFFCGLSLFSFLIY